MLLVLLYLVVAAAHAWLAPLTTGPDELAHYEYVRFVADNGRLPQTYPERDQASYKSDQPPLYHLLAAWPAARIDTNEPALLKRVTDHPRRQLIERTRHAWGLYNTEDELWPYRGEVLRWHIGRWVAILLGAATVAVTYFMARRVFAGSRGAGALGSRGESQPSTPNSKLLALAAAAVVAFIPRFALTGSMLNYETTLAFLSTLFLWMLLRMGESANERMNEWANSNSVRRSAFRVPRSTFYALLTGLFAGLTITAKLSAIIFPLEIVIAFWLIGHYYGWGWKIWLKNVLLAGVATLVTVSWWFGFVIAKFNTVAEEGWWTGLLRPLIAADASDATTNQLLSLLTNREAGFTAAIENLDSGPPWEWAAIFFRTFWSVGIEQVQPLGWFGLAVALGLCVVAAYGIGLVWKQCGRGAAARGSRGAREQGSRVAGAQGRRGTGSQGRRGARAQGSSENNVYATRNTQHAIHLTLSLLLLHIAAAFILPLVRYAITFSLADTAQGRHILFQTAPAIAIIIVWGFSAVSNQYSVVSSRYVIFVPALFLFFWTGVQLWTMTWAYLPLLPVSAQTATQIEHPVNRPVNNFVTLLGYADDLNPESGLLRVDLLWESTAISPVDFLTGITLRDSQNEVRTVWLGHPASGRYPTRAWDVGDTVRDTTWLPVTDLEPGDYQLALNLIPTNLYPPPDLALLQNVPLTTINLSNSPITNNRSLITNPQIWQNGRPVTTPQTFRYRESVLVTFDAPPTDIKIIGPDGRHFSPERQSHKQAIFIVGPDWPTGSYSLQVDAQPGEPLVRVIDRWERTFIEPPMSRRVEANFANQVKLLGYDLPANRAGAGGSIPVTLYWQGLDWMGSDYTIFTKLLKADDQIAYGGRDRLPREGYSTLYWAPTEIISDPFGVPVNPNAPDGIYTINVGLYEEINGQAVSLPLVQDGQLIEANSINIGPIKVGNAPPGLTVAKANPQITVNQSFGNPPALTLLGYDLTDQSGQPVATLNFELKTQNSKLKTLNLKLYWQSEAPLPTDYTTFVHLRNAAGENVAQKDQPPLNGAYPTSLWDSGDIIADEIVLPLPDTLPAGEYQLIVGMYDFTTGQRLPVPNYPNGEVVLAAFRLGQ